MTEAERLAKLEAERLERERLAKANPPPSPTSPTNPGFESGAGPGTKSWKDDPRRINPSQGHPDPKDQDNRSGKPEGPFVDESVEGASGRSGETAEQKRLRDERERQAREAAGRKPKP